MKMVPLLPVQLSKSYFIIQAELSRANSFRHNRSIAVLNSVA